MKNILISVVLISVFCSGAQAKIIAKYVDYRDGGTDLQGYLAYDDSVKRPAPAVVMFHEWWGINPFIESRARLIARLGYVAFCGDIYGKGIRPKTTEEAAKESGKYRTDRRLMVKRAEAALKQVRSFPFVDPKNIVAMGYCFGGGVALELARTGADLKGVVSFHGNLDTVSPADARDFKPSVLVFQGADDPYVPRAAVEKLQDEMTEAKADWYTTIYGGAVHGFTNPENGLDTSKGLAYNQNADMRSWETFVQFLREKLRSK